jgi:hypothetical protein
MTDNPPPTPASDTAEPYAGDMTIVARTFDPTAASLLKGCLQAAGIPAVVADANFIQANTWMTTAAGGVRVMVPASHADHARQVIVDFERGAFELESEDTPPSAPVLRPPEAGLWSPDKAALLCFVFTPLFGAVIHFLNSRALGDKQLVRLATTWLSFGILATVFSMYATLSVRWTVFSPMGSSIFVSAYTVIWYMLAAQAQSKYVVANFGIKYPRRSLAKPGLIAGAVLLAIGAVGAWFE